LAAAEIERDEKGFIQKPDTQFAAAPS